MVCPKCGSDRVTVQLVEADVVVEHHSFFLRLIYWFTIGWLLWMVKMVFKILLLPITIFFPKKEVYGKAQKSVCVCQNCGYHWDA